MIVIVDYGLGNISNVKRAIEHLGYEVVVSNNPKIIDQAETIILNCTQSSRQLNN